MSRFQFDELMPLRDRELIYRRLYLSGILPGNPLGSAEESLKYKRAFDAYRATGTLAPGSGVYTPHTVQYDTLMQINNMPVELPVHIYQHGRYFPLDPHKHDYYELVCVVNGCCHHTIGSDRSILGSGDVAVIPPETIHDIEAFEDDCLVFNLGFKTELVERCFPDLLAQKHPLAKIMRLVRDNLSQGCYIVFHCGDYFQGDNLLASVFEEQSWEEPYTEQIMLALLHTFLLHLMRHFGNNTIYYAPDDMPLGDRVLLYIRNHFRTVSLKELGEQFHYSERQLQRLIQKAAGCSFSTYVAQLRIEYVAEQLRETDASVAQIAKWAGIENITYLYRKFTNQFGVTPAEYRKGKKEDE